jgi:RNA binding activity-knot of a chromodomain
MPSQFRFAGIVTVIFAVCGPARAQELAPAGSGVTINKVVIENGLAHTVKYFVKGGSPQLQAMVRRVEWAENELGVIEQLQLLKLDTVVNERRVAAFRTAQLTNPDYPPGFLPVSIAPVNGGDSDSFLQRSLKRQLAGEATPESALQMIGLLEDLQTQLDAELKALPPQEKKAAQGPIDALRPRVAALPHPDVPPPQPQPVAPRPVGFPAQAVPQRFPMPLNPVAFQQPVRQNQVEVEWQGTWWAAEVMKTNGDRYYIHYTGYNNSWDEWVGPDRIRMPVAKQ